MKSLHEYNRLSNSRQRIQLVVFIMANIAILELPLALVEDHKDYW